MPEDIYSSFWCHHGQLPVARPPSAPDQLTLPSRRAPLRQGSCCAPASLRRTPAGFGPYG
ncbi:hypothetical protein A3T98_20885 [Salmonella enterica subsp. enterica serovar Newport]|nr:hypothetical protein [Salmonella enterica]ECI7009232.1 hypothetical protein [Salmonella enterica subsp. enterica]ECZ9314708.1 hypothetical protein [Salmonella enterica subsp. enterica serovar Newport]EDS5123479.1 hypothetical protein [Salmonella enterica subsp. enterica serovar Mississippi]EEK7855800.1 hypothetical protein [Salmonella enterica subsp. enterica serovar Montevideo]